MRSSVLFAVTLALLGGVFVWSEFRVEARQEKEKADTAKITPAAELTLTKSLKAKVSGEFTNVRLGDILKLWADQVDMRSDQLILWTYGKDFPYAQQVTYRCEGKPLEAALDELFKQIGRLGYIVVSKEGDRHDGWVLLTTTGERGVEKILPKATAAEEADAATKLTLAKKLLNASKNGQAKTVLTFIVKRYPTAKATDEAKALLAKLENSPG